MAMNPMQQQMSPDMLMAMMTDPRASPQQRMAAMSALNTMKGGVNASVPPPQMTGDSTGVSTIDPAFMAAVRQEVMGQGPEAQPEIAQRQAAPEAAQDSTTQALMSGAADASRVAAMARGGEVRGYNEGGGANSIMPPQMTGDSAGVNTINPAFMAAVPQEMMGQRPGEPNEILQRRAARFGSRAMAHGGTVRGYANGGRPLSDIFKEDEIESDGITDWVNKHQKEAKAAIEEERKIFNDPNRSIARKALAAMEGVGTSLFDVYGAGAFGKLFGNPSQVSISGDEVGAVAAPESVAPGPAAPGPAAPPPAAPLPAAPQVAPAVAAPVLGDAPAADPNAGIDPDAYASAMAEIQNNRPETSLDTLKKMIKEKGSDKLSSDDINMALIQAGLGTMAAASQPGAKFLGSIGQGGLVGLEGLEKAKELKAKERASGLETYATLAALEEKNKPGLTKFEEAMDAQAGKDAAEYYGRGGPATTARNLKQLTEVEGILKDAIESGEGITGPVAGLLSKVPLIGSTFFEKTIKTKEMVEQVVQSDLRTILGGQFAQKEGEGVLKRGYNDNLSEEENLRRVQMLISTMSAASKEKEAQARHVRKYGTISNYKGRPVDDYLSDLEAQFDAQDKAARERKNPTSTSKFGPAADIILSGFSGK